jgi:hypothetical protein
MPFNQLSFFVDICFFISASFFLWVKWRKIGSPLVLLIIAISFIYTFGIVKYSILGTMRLNSLPIAMNLDAEYKFISRGESILDSLKSWNKMLRGKKPIYITSGGSEISVNAIGDEKAIKLFKRF